MTHDEKIQWMAVWAAMHGLALDLRGSVGIGRDCVGVTVDNSYPEYEWFDEKTWDRADNNGDVWVPERAYHKHPCVAVLGRGEEAESQLYDWLKWFDDNGFVVETGAAEMDPQLGIIGVLLGKHRYAHMVRSPTAPSPRGSVQQTHYLGPDGKPVAGVPDFEGEPTDGGT